MDLSPDWLLNMDSRRCMSRAGHWLPPPVSLISDLEPWTNSRKSSKMCPLFPTFQSLPMLILASERVKCVPELSMNSFTVELLDFTSKTKSSPKDVVTWTENNWFLPLKWLIKSESQDKPVSKFRMVNSSFVPELMQKEFTDLMNASRDQKVSLTQVQTWFSPKVLIPQNNSK